MAKPWTARKQSGELMLVWCPSLGSAWDKCQTEDLWCVRLQNLYVDSTGRRPPQHCTVRWSDYCPWMDKASIRRDYPQGVKVQLARRDARHGMGRGDVRLFWTVRFGGVDPCRLDECTPGMVIRG
jgi:hypothetical protein